MSAVSVWIGKRDVVDVTISYLQLAPKALLAMHMTCNHDNLVRFRVGAQHYRSLKYRLI
jgi:hypothetical protein